jgi:hypothetical protein
MFGNNFICRSPDDAARGDSRDGGASRHTSHLSQKAWLNKVSRLARSEDESKSAC